MYISKMKTDYYIIYVGKEPQSKSKVVNYECLKGLIGLKNANKTFRAAISMKTDVHTIKFRKYGKCEIRLK